MASVNKAILMGNIGRDPEVRYTPDGSAICSVSIATTSTWKDKATGERREDTEWHRVVFYNRLAEIAGEYLRKGRSVYVEGRLKTRKLQDGAANALLAPNGGCDGIGVGAIGFGASVRRLTPRECERLQGFPDDYTRIPWRAYQAAMRKGYGPMAIGGSFDAFLAEHGMTLREPAGRECPDGPRYRALGNSMAVPVMRWIGQRIAEVKIIEELA